MRSRDQLTRRDMLRLGAAGVLTAGGSGWFGALANHVRAAEARPRSCILLWMNGGPSQGHTFDVKPGGEYQTIATSVPGIAIADCLPGLARQMEHLALIRSMSTASSDHGPANYLLRTGFKPAGDLVYPVLGSIGSATLSRPDETLPNYISIHAGIDGNNAAEPLTTGPGHLGPRHAALVIADAALGLENLKSKRGEAEAADRAKLLDAVQERTQQLYQAEAVNAHRTAYQRALRLMQSPKGKAFEIDRESDKVRDAYGRSKFGEACLLARRLLEAGVPFVEVILGGWDDHGPGRGGLAAENVKRRCGYMDPAMTALIGDLKAAGLFDTTLLVWMGEFGRSPGNATGHFARAWTTVLAGAGVKTGQVIGRTSANGGGVEERPVRAQDFMATVLHALAIDPAKKFDVAGRPVPRVDRDGTVIKELF